MNPHHLKQAPQGAPAPQAKPQPMPQAKRKAMPKPILMAATAAVLAVSLTTAKGFLFPPTAEVAPAEAEVRLNNFTAAPYVQLKPINLADPQEQAEALQSLQQAFPNPEELQAHVQASDRLVWIEVFDDCAEDEDIVNIRTFSYSQNIPLFNVPTRVAIGLSPGEKNITVTGIEDGGGGITVAIKTEGRLLPLPVMKPGQTILIPVY